MSAPSAGSPRLDAILGRLQPGASHQLLLNAALPSDARAIESWQRRYRLSSLECQDDGEFQLLPLVYSSLRDLNYAGPEMAKLQGVYHQAWYRSQLLFRSTTAAMQQLQAAGVPALMTGGLAAIARFYPPQHLRTVREGELLIDAGHLQAAALALLEGGWLPRGVSRDFPNAQDQRYGHLALFLQDNPEVAPQTRATPRATPRTKPDGQARSEPAKLEQPGALRLYLRWKLIDPLATVQTPAAAAPALPAGVPCQAQDQAFLTLDATTCLLDTCLRAFPSDPAALPWIADALMILRARTGAVDWQSLAAHAISRGAAVPLLAALSYLTECYEIPIPPAALHALASTGCTSGDETLLDCLTTAEEDLTRRQQLRMAAHVFRRGEQNPDAFGYLKRFPAFLNYYWGPKGFLRRLVSRKNVV